MCLKFLDMNKYIRIHGDNIIECERTLKLISEAFKVVPVLEPNAPIYMPVYNIDYIGISFRIELLSGYNRWGMNIGNVIKNFGGALKEGADSYITEVVDELETVILAIEYCSALPAGNNAWQRNGRAYSCMQAGIPYLYFAEIGGVELDKNRCCKAPRFPNPIVPFSYISSSDRLGANCMPVYRPHPSIPTDIYNKYKESFGLIESENIIKNILLGLDYAVYKNALNEKCMSLIKKLSALRRTKDTLKGEDWNYFFEAKDAEEWLSQSKSPIIWRKKFIKKVKITEHFSKFKDEILKLGCLSIGAKDVPICLITKDKITLFNKLFNKFFTGINHSFSNDKNLAIVWITGYKPKGDDSRPDRGLTSLARMVLGNEVNILSLVYGPAKKNSYSILSTLQGYESNGMWESVIKLSDYALFDSVNYPQPIFHKINRNKQINNTSATFDFVKASLNCVYGEHDVDSTIHKIFGCNSIEYIKECFCNPPGGDWSGISYFASNNEEYRWTSLPRVSTTGGKRPDHVIQIKKKLKDIFLSIESKGSGRNLEKKIGINLKKYIDDIYKKIPTAIKGNNGKWRNNSTSVVIPTYHIISVGTFLYNNVEEMNKLLETKNLDSIISVEFRGNTTTLHVVTNSQGYELINILKEIQSLMGNFIISVH